MLDFGGALGGDDDLAMSVHRRFYRLDRLISSYKQRAYHDRKNHLVAQGQQRIVTCIGVVPAVAGGLRPLVGACRSVSTQRQTLGLLEHIDQIIWRVLRHRGLLCFLVRWHVLAGSSKPGSP